MAGMVATRQRPKPVTVADPDEKMTMAGGRRLAGVSLSVMRSRRPELLEAGAVQLSATRWEITPRQMEAAGIIKIRQPKPAADPLEAAQKAREAARAAEREEVRRASPTREESAGTPPPDAREAERRANVADPYGARVRRSAEESQAAAAYAAAIDGKPVRVTGVHWTEGMPGASDTAVTIAELRHAAELAEARHAAEIADARRQIAEAEAKARAWQERAGTMEMLAAERGRMIAMLEAMLGGAAPVARALDA